LIFKSLGWAAAGLPQAAKGQAEDGKNFPAAGDYGICIGLDCTTDSGRSYPGTRLFRRRYRHITRDFPHRRGESSSVPVKPHTAANESQTPGMARFPVTWMRYVQMAGVNPPKTAVAKL